MDEKHIYLKPEQQIPLASFFHRNKTPAVGILRLGGELVSKLASWQVR